MEYLIRGLIYGIGMFLIEMGFRCLTSMDEKGNVHFCPNLSGRSSWAMFAGSVICGLYLVEPAYRLLIYLQIPVYLRLPLWPFIIWGIEIIWGAFLFYKCNSTRAWYYGGKGACLNGFIKLTYYPYWMMLGGALEYFYYLIRMTSLKPSFMI